MPALAGRCGSPCWSLPSGSSAQTTLPSSRSRSPQRPATESINSRPRPPYEVGATGSPVYRGVLVEWSRTATLTAPAPVQAPPGYTLTPINPHQRPLHPAKPGQTTPPSMTLLYVWILLFGFVGTQLAWTLRPFFGSPGMKFSLYRDIDGNFYAEIIRSLADLF